MYVCLLPLNGEQRWIYKLNARLKPSSDTPFCRPTCWSDKILLDSICQLAAHSLYAGLYMSPDEKKSADKSLRLFVHILCEMSVRHFAVVYQRIGVHMLASPFYDTPSRLNGYNAIAIRYNIEYLTCSKKSTCSQLSLPHGTNRIKIKNKCVSKTHISPYAQLWPTSASVELTQTRHSYSKQLFHGGQISQCFYREGQKATYAACKPLF